MQTFEVITIQTFGSKVFVDFGGYCYTELFEELLVVTITEKTIGIYAFDEKKNRCISCTDNFTKINFHSIFETLKPAVELIFDSSDSTFLSFNKSLTSLAVIIWSKHLNTRLSGMKMRCISYTVSYTVYLISYTCNAYLHSIIYSINRVSYTVYHIVKYTVHVYMRCCNMYCWPQTIARW